MLTLSSGCRSGELSPADMPWAPGGSEARSERMERFLRGHADTLYHPVGAFHPARLCARANRTAIILRYRS